MGLDQSVTIDITKSRIKTDLKAILNMSFSVQMISKCLPSHGIQHSNRGFYYTLNWLALWPRTGELPWHDLLGLMFLILATVNPDALKIRAVAYSVCCQVNSVFMGPDQIKQPGCTQEWPTRWKKTKQSQQLQKEMFMCRVHKCRNYPTWLFWNKSQSYRIIELYVPTNRTRTLFSALSKIFCAHARYQLSSEALCPAIGVLGKWTEKFRE